MHAFDNGVVYQSLTCIFSHVIILPQPWLRGLDWVLLIPKNGTNMTSSVKKKKDDRGKIKMLLRGLDLSRGPICSSSRFGLWETKKEEREEKERKVAFHYCQNTSGR